MARRDINMTEGPLLKNILFYTVPIILTGVLQLLFNAADLVVVGRFCGSISVAAVGATGALINLLVNFFMGLSVGSGVTVAHAVGAGDKRSAVSVVHTSIPTALIGGILLTVIGICFARPLLQLMGNPDDVIGKSTVYMQFYFCGITGTMLYNFGAAILRAVGDTKRPLIYLTISGIVNVLLNLILVIVLHMDVAGVALATAVSQTLSAVLVLRSLTRRQDACRLDFRLMRIEKAALSKILRIGVPAGIQSSLFSISNVIIQSSVNSFGSTVMSGHAAAANIEGFIYTAQNAFSQTSLNFTGQNIGAKNHRRVMKVFWGCTLLVTLIGGVLGLLSLIFAKPLLSIYITDSVKAIGYGVVRMAIISPTYFLCGIMEVVTGVLRGMGRSVSPMVVSILGACGFRILWIYTVFRIPQFHTLQCLYLSYPISWVLTAAVEIIIMFSVYKKLLKSAT